MSSTSGKKRYSQVSSSVSVSSSSSVTLGGRTYNICKSGGSLGAPVKSRDVLLLFKEDLCSSLSEDEKVFEVQSLCLWVADEEESPLESKALLPQESESIYETIPHEFSLLEEEEEQEGDYENVSSLSNMFLAAKNRLSETWSSSRRRNSLGEYGRVVLESTNGMRRLKKRLSTGKNCLLGSFSARNRSSSSLRPNKSEPTFYVRSPGGGLQTEEEGSSATRKTRRRSSSSKSAIVRPKEAPPAPPPLPPLQRPLPERDNAIEEVYCSYLFASEPLYHQFYEEIGFKRNKSLPRVSTMALLSNRPEEEGPPRTPKRTLWSQLAEVQEGILVDLSPKEISLQEALFEVITSEASYLKSLNVFTAVFMASKDLEGALNRPEYEALFSDVVNIRKVSEKFFFELDSIWQKSLFMEGLLEVFEAYSRGAFRAYVKYTANRVYSDGLLASKMGEEAFRSLIRDLEASPLCESLSLHSFLLLPMQRITRYPLLLSAILKFIPPSEERTIGLATSALQNMNDLVFKCNESARQMERMEVMLKLSSSFDFNDLRSIPLLSPGRWLLRRTSVLRLDSSSNLGESSGPPKPLTLSNKLKMSKTHLHLFLFTDLLVIVKQKSEDHYKVIDHCPRNLLCMSEDGLPERREDSSPGLFRKSSSTAWLTLLKNHERRTLELLLSFESCKELHAWRDLLRHEKPSSPEGEVIYESWDCPLVEAKEDIPEDSNGSLLLPRGCRGRLRKKAPDGSQFLVERLDESSPRGGVWVSSTAVEEIHSSHVAAKHLRQRYKFLKLVGSKYSSMPP